MSVCQYFISGKVQGVFFRQSTVDEATRLGLNGFAKNLADGRVEVVAEGDDDVLEHFAAWLHEGPPMASVTEIEQHVIDIDVPQGFVVSY